MESADDKAKFWHIAYHGLFYTHLYLHPTAAAFKPWANHRAEYEFMGPIPWDGNRLPRIGKLIQKAELLKKTIWRSADSTSMPICQRLTWLHRPALTGYR